MLLRRRQRLAQGLTQIAFRFVFGCDDESSYGAQGLVENDDFELFSSKSSGTTTKVSNSASDSARLDRMQFSRLYSVLPR